jgi:CelD/BcsL family acetyltransferase involved in cellulose biosynthesis
MTQGGASAGPRLRVRLDPCPDIPVVAAAWRALEPLAAPNFFSSWTWIGCWLQQLPPSLRPLLLQVHAEGPSPWPDRQRSMGRAQADRGPDAAAGPTLGNIGVHINGYGGADTDTDTDNGSDSDSSSQCVGLGLLVPHRTRRLRCWPSRGLLLHASGDAALDAITIEHNGLLARRDMAARVQQAAWQALLGVQMAGGDRLPALGRKPGGHAGRTRRAALTLRMPWQDDPPRFDHVRIPGAADTDLLTQGHHSNPGGLMVHRYAEAAWRTDLPALAQGSDDIVAGLGPGTRASIRRSLRRYAALGPVVLEAAASLDEALDFLQRLKHWHQRQWNARGEAGAFANPRFEAFHRELIAAAWPAGQVELLRLRAGPHEVGLLYNFVHGTTVSTYQSGLNLGLDAGNHHPGLVLHAQAMQRAYRAGHTVYDFLAGDARHKRQLGAQGYAMVTLHWSRSGAVARLESVWRAFKNGLTRQRAKAARAEDAQANRPWGVAQ